MLISIICNLLCETLLKVNEQRRKIVDDIERVAEKMWSQGRCAAWLADADPLVQKVRIQVVLFSISPFVFVSH